MLDTALKNKTAAISIAQCVRNIGMERERRHRTPELTLKYPLRVRATAIEPRQRR